MDDLVSAGNRLLDAVWEMSKYDEYGKKIRASKDSDQAMRELTRSDDFAAKIIPYMSATFARDAALDVYIDVRRKVETPIDIQ
jgi:hypothetical protein